jgi:hypothetical protein
MVIWVAPASCLGGAPPTLPNIIILPGVTAVSIILPDQLPLFNSKVGQSTIPKGQVLTAGTALGLFC